MRAQRNRSRVGIALLVVMALGAQATAWALNEEFDPPLVQGQVAVMALDAAGNRYFAGNFITNRDFDPSPASAERTSLGGTDVFVTKQGPTGNHIWTQTFGGTAGENAGEIVVTATTVYVCGSTQSTDARLAGQGNPIGTGGGGEAYVFALNVADGSPVTAFGGDGLLEFGGSGDDEFNDMAILGNRLYLAGYFVSPSAGFDGAIQVSNSDSGGTQDGIVAVLNATTGAPDISFSSDGFVTLAGSNDETINAITVNASGQVFITGEFSSINFGVNALGGTPAIGLADVFVGSLTPGGMPDPTFAGDGIQTFGGSQRDQASELVVDGTNLFVCGGFASSNAGFAGAPGSFSTVGMLDAFVFKLDANGLPVNGFDFDGVVTFGGASGNEIGNAVVVTATGVYVCGSYTSTIGGFGGSGSTASSGSEDAFIIGVSPINGSPLAQFSSDGAQIFGGVAQESASCIVASGGIINVVGIGFSSSAMLGGIDPVYNFSSVGGFLLLLDENNGLQDDLYEQNDAPSVTFPLLPIDSTVAANLFANDDDYYVVDVGTGQLQSTLVHDPSATSVTFELRDAAGSLLATAAITDPASRQIDFDILTAGKYLLRVNIAASAAARSYSLQTNASPPPTSGPPPVITSLTVSQNPARTGIPVTFTTVATDPSGGPVTFNYEFGVALANDSVNPAVFTYFVAGTYTITVTVTGPTGDFATQSLMLRVVGPNSGGEGVPCIATDDPAVANPLNGLTVMVAGSEGGVVDLAVSVDALNRAVFDVDTTFTDLPGRGTPTVRGMRPVNLFQNSGIFISTTKATDTADGLVKGRVRKTLPISRRETGETALITAAPPATTISKFSLKGKFVFDKPGSFDEVTFSGSIQMPVGMDLTQPQPFSVSVGNVVEDVTLDPKGKPTSTGATGLIKKMKVSFPKAKKGVTKTIAGQIAKFSFTLRLQDADIAGFDTEGITNSLATSEAGSKTVPRKIQTALVLAGVSYDGLIDVQYKLAKDQGDGVLSGRGGK